MSHVDQYNRGSEWRKWDLHVHTPNTALNDGFFGSTDDEKWEKWLTEIENSDVKVIGVTDYFSIENYKKVAKYKEDGKLANVNALFPNVELRMLPSTNGGRCINIHCIFNPEIVDKLANQFFQELTFEYRSNPYKATRDDLIALGKAYENDDEIDDSVAYRKGVEQFKVDFSQLKAIFKNNPKLREETMVVLANSSNDGNSGIQHHSLAATRQEIYRFADAIFSANPKDREYFLAEGTDNKSEILRKYGKLKPCVHGSDAHAWDKLLKPDEDRFCWIKADPTFEGFRQIVYEPKERVLIQDTDPSFRYNKPYFSEVEIQDEVAIFEQDENQVYFCKETLPLNKNLVAIIGGRGTGKSMLVDYWANIFERHRDYYSADGDFAVEYAKDNVPTPTKETYNGDEENYLDFIYIPQSKLKEVSKKERIEQEVKKLLDLQDLYFSQDLNEEIQGLLGRIEKLQDWFEEEDEEGRQLNQQSYVEALKKKSGELLKSITTQKNKEKLEKYTENIGKIREFEASLELLSELEEQLEQTKEALDESVDEINERLPQKDGFKEIKQVNFKIQLDDIVANKKILETQKKKKQTENQTIKEDFEKEKITGDLSSLLKNAGAYQSRIKWADKQLITIAKKKVELSQELQKRDNLAAKLRAEYEGQRSQTDKAWQGILEKHEGVHKELIERILLKEGKTSVEGEIVFDEKAFYDKLLNIVDRRTYRDVAALRKRIKVSNFEDWIKFVGTELKDLIDGEEAERFEGIENVIFGLKERGEYLRTLPKITYDGRKLSRLSVGQRGTVYLCLRLATDAFSKPIIFDQPEDDLDNKFIVNELIDIFRELKKYRQIIIVTHNANLVVNADAEQVIVAKNDSEKLSYDSGSLENVSIIKSVCEILEGGEEAFEKRKHKYHFN